MTFEIGERVQASRFYLLRKQKYHGFEVTDTMMGVVQGYRSPLKGVPRVEVRWFTGKSWPDQFDRAMRVDYIEPLGTKR